MKNSTVADLINVCREMLDDYKHLAFEETGIPKRRKGLIQRMERAIAAATKESQRIEK